ncbi:MAG: hypothetical protein IIX54_03125, partial [Clostridia bacterium]|nr:hypothetical protein [Clostridia bacterium]
EYKKNKLQRIGACKFCENIINAWRTGVIPHCVGKCRKATKGTGAVSATTARRAQKEKALW